MQIVGNRYKVEDRTDAKGRTEVVLIDLQGEPSKFPKYFDPGPKVIRTMQIGRNETVVDTLMAMIGVAEALIKKEEKI